MQLDVEEIPRIAAPGETEFAREFLRRRRPVVLLGLTEDWRSPSLWTFANLAERWGDARVVAAALAGGTLYEDPVEGVVFRRPTLRDVVESFARPGAGSDYVMAPTDNFPPAFAGDYSVPRYCRSASHLRAKVWLGKAGTVTPLHRDVPHNLHVHLSGRKRWLLFSPRESARLYPRSFFSGMPNFSRVDPEQPEDPRFPRLREAHALGATLDAGETLFIPHGWWHHTRSLDDAVAMNFWWGGSLVQLASLASTAWKRARGIRRGEWASEAASA